MAPVLIQVPALADGGRWGARPLRRQPIRRRRRLRREVRIAGSALLLGMPMAAAAMMLGGAHPALPPEQVPVTRAKAEAETPPVVSIAMPIESEPPVPPRELVPPVQFPDYVLPDDGSEEAAHAGS